MSHNPDAPRGLYPISRSVYRRFEAWQIWYEANGEFRPPKPGEYFLSGAVPEVYQHSENATEPLDSSYWIMVKAFDPTTQPPDTIIHKGFVYHRGGPVR